MGRIQRGWPVAGVLALALLVSPMATAQAGSPEGAGVATTVSGHVTVSHAVSPAPRALNFKDEVFYRDRISTAARSLARLLLGKKAVVTVRELSELQLIDQAGTSTVQLALGKIAIGVARQRMRPGETVEIRTQNAVAAIRGTVVVAETLTPPGGSDPVTRLHVLSGYIDVTAPGNPGAPPLRLVAPSSVTVTGNTMENPVPLDAAARAALLSDLRPTPPLPTRALEGLVLGEQARAAGLARIITGDGSGGDELLDVQGPPVDVQGPTTPTTPSTTPTTPNTPSGGPSSSLPLIWNGQAVNFPRDLYQVPPFSSQSISTDLLRATNSILTVGGDVLEVKGSLSSATTRPFASLAGSTLDAQTLTLIRNGTLSLTGTLLDAVKSTVKISGAALVEIQANSSLTGASVSPLVGLTSGTLQLGGASGFSLTDGGTANLSGALLSTSGADVTSTGDFVLVRTRGRLAVTGSAAPLLSLAGGNSHIATAGSIFRLAGAKTALDPVSGMTVGTEEPIQHGGGFLEMNAATVTTARAVKVDVALLQASAPLLNLFGAGGAQLTTSGNAIDLTSKAKVTNTAAFVALDQSRLIVNNAALVNVAGASFLKGGGNLVNLANGSTLTINNGVLLSVSGGSIVNLSGALIAFSGAPGNSVTVSNALKFVNIGGIPVALTGGALAGNVVITGTPIKNANLGAITPNKALIQVNGAATKVTISGN